MSATTNIQWTDVTDNIIVVEGGGWWCRKISPGCANCYAAKLNQSTFFGGNKRAYSGEAPTMVLRPEICDGWARQTKPKRHFVASMTDVFGEWVTQNQVDYFLYSMLAAPGQTFQILTKRPDVAKHCIDIWLDGAGLVRLPDNIWLGVSVEDQQRADERIPILLSIPAKVRFLSVEPLLELTLITTPKGGRLDWVIVGGESGVDSRPCRIDWIRSIMQQCRLANCPCFVKQVGSSPVGNEMDKWVTRMNHPKGGDMQEWSSDLRVREFPTV